MAATIPGAGHKGSFLFAKEATYGTAPAAATIKHEFESFTWATPDNAIEDPNMNTSGASSRAITPGLQFVTGSFRMRLGYDGCEEILRWLLPVYAGSTVETTARDHLYKEGTTLFGGTFDVSYGDIPTSKATRLVGMLCTGFDIDWSSSIAMLTANFACYGPPAPNTTVMTGTPSVLNKIPIWHHGHLVQTTGNLKDGSGFTETAILLRTVKLSVNYPHDTARGFGGSKYADSPVRNGPMTARIDFEMQWDATTFALASALLGDTIAAGGLKLLWQHPTTIGASSKREFEIIASSPIAPSYSAPIDGPGVIFQKYGYRLQYNDTDSSCIKVRNRNITTVLA